MAIFGKDVTGTNWGLIENRINGSKYPLLINGNVTKITCPVLALQGEDDEYGTPAQVEGIAEHVSGPVNAVLIPKCGHIPHFQAKKKVIVEMTRFIIELIN